MILAVVVILIIALSAYFHYVQGLFSATISAVCAILSAIIAVSYHEKIVASLLKGAMANQAHAMTLCATFAITYVIMRMLADKIVPGNVRYPLMVDKIGSAVMGIVAGLFAGGVVALAAGALPFGASALGYARYSTYDRSVVIPGSRNSIDSMTFDEIKDANLDTSKTALDASKLAKLLVPVDDMLVGIVNTLSTGALANDHPLNKVHPDWPTELFLQRAGVQIGTKHVSFNLPGRPEVDLKDLFAMDSVREFDGEMVEIRENKASLAPIKGDALKVPADQTLLIVRIGFESNASDEDGKVRISCGAVRLVGCRDDTYINYYPVGTLEGTTLLRNKPDDPLVVSGGKGADFVFKLPRSAVYTDASAKGKDFVIKPGVFVEVKRMAQIDLSEKPVKSSFAPSSDVEVLRKSLDFIKTLPKHGESGPSQPVVETVPGPIDISLLKVSDRLFSKVNPGQYQGDSNIAFKSGNATMKSNKFAKLLVNGTDTLPLLSAGDNATDVLFVPEGKKLVQVVGKAKAGADDAWEWAGNLTKFELQDATGAKFKVNGAFAQVRAAGSAARMVANYDAENEVQSVEKVDGRPYDIYLTFAVPSGKQITQVTYDNVAIFGKGINVP